MKIPKKEAAIRTTPQRLWFDYQMTVHLQPIRETTSLPVIRF